MCGEGGKKFRAGFRVGSETKIQKVHNAKSVWAYHGKCNAACTQRIIGLNTGVMVQSILLVYRYIIDCIAGLQSKMSFYVSFVVIVVVSVDVVDVIAVVVVVVIVVAVTVLLLLESSSVLLLFQALDDYAEEVMLFGEKEGAIVSSLKATTDKWIVVTTIHRPTRDIKTTQSTAVVNRLEDGCHW